jgi:hypothetical protein
MESQIWQIDWIDLKVACEIANVQKNNRNDFVRQRITVRNALQYPDSPACAHFDTHPNSANRHRDDT